MYTLAMTQTASTSEPQAGTGQRANPETQRDPWREPMNRNISKILAAGTVALSMAFAPAAFAMGHGGHGGGHHSSGHHGGGHKSSGHHGGGHHSSGHHNSGHHSSGHHGHHGGHHVTHHTPKHHVHGHGHATHTPVCVKFDWVIEHGHQKWACVLSK